MRLTCRNGHPKIGTNAYVSPKGYRECRLCRRDSSRKFRLTQPDGYESPARARWKGRYFFNGLREQIIQRDYEQYVACHMTRNEHRARYGRDLTIDHIDGLGRNAPRELKNNDPGNLQTLCLKCHGAKDGALSRRE